MTISIVDNRFILDEGPPRVGGTAHVFRAQDHAAGGAPVAIKLYDGVAIDDELRLEMFRREKEALGALSHPHIVRLIAAGHDSERGQHYLALEWLEEDLSSYLRRDGQTSVMWSKLVYLVVRPLLEALTAAQARRIIHRDIKPQNIMVDARGTVKLTDFGIARLLDSVRLGMTVSDLHSRPYAAPERDAGELDSRSDLYSLGMTIIDLLRDLRSHLPQDADPHAVLDEVQVPEEAQRFLRWLTAADPADRPYSPKLALLELERLSTLEPTASNKVHGGQLRVILTRAVLDQAREQLGVRSESEVRQRVIADLSDAEECPTLAPNRKADISWADESSVPLDLSGVELAYSARFDQDHSGQLILTSANILPPSVHARRRERALEIDHQLVFDRWAVNQRENADLLVEALIRLAGRQDEGKRVRSEAELFERWRAVLDAKSELESQREDPLPYNNVRRNGRGAAAFRVPAEVDERYLDQTRRIAIPGAGPVVGTVVEVGKESIVLEVERGNVEALPPKGQLRVDRTASKRAIDRQKQALNAVRDGEGAREDLGELLVQPSSVAPLTPTRVDQFFQDLDAPKRYAVEVALASADFTLVQGPPGTGKTTFIAELISQLLAAHPQARVLLSSQTHVAVDNAAVKLSELRDDVRIVRVGPEEKIDEAASSLAVREQLRAWRADARGKAKVWLDAWGERRGISAEALHAYATAADITQLERALARLQARLEVLAKEEERLLDLLTNPNRPPPSTVATGEMVADEEDELTAVQDEMESRRQEVAELESELEERHSSFSEQLRVPEKLGEDERRHLLADRFAVAPDDLEQYLRLVSLRDDWLVRFGQGEDFTESLLATASVVAGTCVGLAGSLDDIEHFDLAIVDEASKATPTEALIPMVHSRRWVLVGDERQLPPYLDSGLVDEGLLEGHGLERWDLEETLFSQLEAGLPENRRVLLTEQHRMLSPIGDLVSRCFYDGSLTSSRPANSAHRCLIEVFPEPVTWYSTVQMRGRRERKLGTTYWNESEIRVVRELLNKLQKRARAHEEHLTVAVISGYGEQARRIQRNLRPQDSKWSHLDIHVHPVDSFQGQERDVVIYSVTRSNKANVLGFLRSERRINVALSRAKDALVVVGDHRFCARARNGDNPFAKVLNHIRESQGCRLEEVRRQ